MPLIYSKKFDTGINFAVWHSTEETPELLKILGREPGFLPIKSEKRKRELITARILLKEVLGDNVDIIYEQTGKPVLKGYDSKISVAHTGDFVAVLIHPEKESGVDIELLHERIFKIVPKFISDEESKIFRINDLTELYKIWGAKEVVYKIYGKKEVDFKEDLLCVSINNTSINVKHRLPNPKNYNLTCEFLTEYNLIMIYGFDE